MILLIDNSASMAATDVEPTRLESAKAQADALIGKMEPGDAAMIVTFNDSAAVTAAYSENVPALRKAIATIRQTGRRTSLVEALRIAGGLANPERTGEEFAEAVPAKVHLFSDGGFEAIDDQTLGNLDMEFHQIGSTGDNIGLMALSARRDEKDTAKLVVFARMRNFRPTGSAKANVVARLFVDENFIDRQAVDVEAGEERSITFGISDPGQSTVAVKLDFDDAFAMDNQAWIITQPPRKAKIIAVGESNKILAAALRTSAIASIADVVYEKSDYAKRDLAADSQAANADLIIFDRCAPTIMPDCNTLFIAATPPTLADLEIKKIEMPTIETFDAAHPILRFLQLDDVDIYQALAFDRPKGAKALIESDKGDLLLAMPRGVHTDVIQTFALMDGKGTWATNWPLRASFPLYVLNLVRSLGGVDAEEKQSYQAGDAVSLRGNTAAKLAKVTLPDGQVRDIPPTRPGVFDFLDTDMLGAYVANLADQKSTFAVDLFDERESNIAPAQSVRVGSVTVSGNAATVASNLELWRPLAALALVLLLFEWYIYNRRVYL